MYPTVALAQAIDDTYTWHAYDHQAVSVPVPAEYTCACKKYTRGSERWAGESALTGTSRGHASAVQKVQATAKYAMKVEVTSTLYPVPVPYP